MNVHQVGLPKASANGFTRRRGGDKEVGNRVENKSQSGKAITGRIPSPPEVGNRVENKSQSGKAITGRIPSPPEVGNRVENKSLSGKAITGRIPSPGALGIGKDGGYSSPSRDRLVYLATCLIGHPVEVHVKNGSIYTGIFHATDAERDFGIILKMARLTKDGTLRGQKEFISKAPSKTFIIPAKELVQVMAKDVAVSRDGLASELEHEKRQELMIDSAISQSRSLEVGRELEPWIPDEDVPKCSELENIFAGPWKNRSWDQFETNEVLFGVKSTFDEELYTTKLQRGPQTRELEREAIRIAREIESEETEDLHLAEERGFKLHDDLDIDEETRFSSVCRSRRVDDSGYDENEEILLDSLNFETFGGSSGPVSKKPADLSAQGSSSSSSVEEASFSQSCTSLDTSHAGSNDHARQLAHEFPSSSSASGSESRSSNVENDMPYEHGGIRDVNKSGEKSSPYEDPHSLSFVDSRSLMNEKIESSDKSGLPADATGIAESQASTKGDEKPSCSVEISDGPISNREPAEVQSGKPRGRPSSSASSNSDQVGSVPPSSQLALSSSSSLGSLSSEKSTLNPYAKEFKLNPNAKSFTPSQASVRPPSPVSDGSLYYPASMSPVPHVHGMPVGFGIGSPFAGHQPVIFNPPMAPMQSPQAYFHPNGHQYGQQMLLGQPRPVLYMPAYQPEMQYKGRDY